MSEHNLVVLRGVLAADVPSARAAVRQRARPVRRHDPRRRRHAVRARRLVRPAGVGRRCRSAGADVVVLGSVRRRFFRAGGATQSRTEVVAEKVVAAPGPRRRRLVETACRAQVPVEREGGRVAAVEGARWTSRAASDSRSTKPVRSFGVKNVDFGGIRRPSRAVRSISAMLTGRISTAAVAVAGGDRGEHLVEAVLVGDLGRGAVERVLEPGAVERPDAVERAGPRGQPLGVPSGPISTRRPSASIVASVAGVGGSAGEQVERCGRAGRAGRRRRCRV